MGRFVVFSHATIVGTSHLERGDAPMGVAHGCFVPREGYSLIQRHCTGDFTNKSSLGLSVKTEDGELIECVGVSIVDYSADLGPDGIEVTVAGIPYPVYSELFPHHVAAYKQQFGDA